MATAAPALVAASVLFVAGLWAPAFSVAPPTGETYEIMRAFDSSFDTISTPRSIMSSIGELFASGSYLLASVLAVFSVAFPAAKLVLLWTVVVGRASTRALAILDHTGKYSMLDVLVLALLLLTFKSLPGGARFRIEFGAVLFAGSVLLTMAVPRLMATTLARASRRQVG